MKIHSTKYSQRENELINLVDDLNISGFKKSEHSAYYWEVCKLVTILSDEVNKWIFNTDSYQMAQYKRCSQDIKSHTLKELDSKLRIVKLWLQQEIRLCIEAKYTEIK